MQACRNVLRVVVDGLAPGGYLKHAPVRTFFRIVSVTLVLVKTFAFGAFENEMAFSLSLMDRTVETMRNCVVDDVHLSNRFSNFLEVITNRLRPMIVRMSRTNGGGQSSNTATSRVSSRGVSQSPAPPRANDISMREPAYTSHNSDFGTQHDRHDAALYGIPTQTYDISSSSNAFSIMPPPASPSLHPTEFQNSYHNFESNAGFGDDAGDAVGEYDWLALPLDPILAANGQDVTNTCFGPGIGDYDMLEVLLGSGQGQGR